MSPSAARPVLRLRAGQALGAVLFGEKNVVVLAGVEGRVEVDEIDGLVAYVALEDVVVVSVIELVLLWLVLGHGWNHGSTMGGCERSDGGDALIARSAFGCARAFGRAVRYPGSEVEFLRKLYRHLASKKFAFFIQRGSSEKFSSGVGRGFHRIHGDTLLAGVAPFLADSLRLHSGGRHDENVELDGFDGFSELLPPANSAFEEIAVLFDDNIRGLLLQAFAQIGGELLAVGTSVREKDSAARIAGHDSYYSSRARDYRMTCARNCRSVGRSLK